MNIFQCKLFSRDCQHLTNGCYFNIKSGPFTIAYQQKTHSRISPAAVTEVRKALLQEKAIIEDPDPPISGYNCSAMKDRLKEKGIRVSVTTIIIRAKKLDCHKP